MNMHSLERGDMPTGYCDVCDRIAWDLEPQSNGAIEPWRWEGWLACGACRFEHALWEAQEETLIQRALEAEAKWMATHCECNGGNPCACPDCDHEDCSYRDPDDREFGYVWGGAE